jgi:hypothetical protein
MLGRHPFSVSLVPPNLKLRSRKDSCPQDLYIRVTNSLSADWLRKE